ncbi:hypothetical protein ABIA33_000507 [Streptacidiphilus sp. MAP12-16]|uniref:CDP-alcohol phosphatidyltransferase family protein n=1 Tax=Streptacidiphilus sp. MAP12-16 TaxID=3156300 RepID=UPI00351364F2
MKTPPALPIRQVLGRADSRAATDALLTVLHRDGWARFLIAAGQRSAYQAACRPGALLEVTALHGLMLGRTPGRRKAWVAASWILCATHLGLLEERRHLSVADLITLCRGNLPALFPKAGRWVVVGAVLSDCADGRLARRLGTVSPFGAYADTFADAAFWTRLALRHEPDPRWRRAALVAWAAPVAAVAAASMARGRMLDAPHPVVVRPAAAMQVVLAVRRWRSASRGNGLPEV